MVVVLVVAGLAESVVLVIEVDICVTLSAVSVDTSCDDVVKLLSCVEKLDSDALSSVKPVWEGDVSTGDVTCGTVFTVVSSVFKDGDVSKVNESDAKLENSEDVVVLSSGVCVVATLFVICVVSSDVVMRAVKQMNVVDVKSAKMPKSTI